MERALQAVAGDEAHVNETRNHASTVRTTYRPNTVSLIAMVRPVPGRHRRSRVLIRVIQG